jgi:hypothetical protein
MTLKQIRAKFTAGEEWTADNTYDPHASGPRVLVEMRSTQFIWKTSQAERSFHAYFVDHDQMFTPDTRRTPLSGLSKYDI